MKATQVLFCALTCACSGRAVSIGSNPATGGATGGAVNDGSGGSSGSSGSSASSSSGGSPSGGAAGGASAEGGRAGSDAGSSTALGCARQLASGDSHACVLFDDARVACVGFNDFGQLGNGNRTRSSVLMPVGGLVEPRSIAAGGDHTCAATQGSVFCWGDNVSGELGVENIAQSSEPVLALSGAQLGGSLVQLSLGSRFSCALNHLVHGTCWGEGEGSPRQIGEIGAAPLQVLQTGGPFTRLIDDGALYEVTWARIGNGSVAQKGITLVQGATSGVVTNAVGWDHECIVKSTGTVWCRRGVYPPFYTVVMEFGRDVVDVKVGTGFNCARTRAGRVLCSGRNQLAQRGDGTLTENGVVTEVPGIDDAVEISLGSRHACARRADGSVWCWGGMLADEAPWTMPVRIAGPAPLQKCMNVQPVPSPWGLPALESTPVDELADALNAWGQTQCLCGQAVELAPLGPAGLDECVKEETRALNGCLRALAPDTAEFARCRAPGLWDQSACAAKCVQDKTGLSECLPPSGSQCAPLASQAGVLGFCMRNRLACDEAGDARVGALQTCDGIRDCANGFDEANCAPNSTVFTCAEGARIARTMVRDNSRQCPDGSDEWF